MSKVENNLAQRNGFQEKMKCFNLNFNKTGLKPFQGLLNGEGEGGREEQKRKQVILDQTKKINLIRPWWLGGRVLDNVHTS